MHSGLASYNLKTLIKLVTGLILIFASQAFAQHSTDKQQEESCLQAKNGPWVDRMQAQTYTSLCRSVRWIDGLFGNSEHFNDKQFNGRISLGAIIEEGGSIDPKLRLRLDTDLPNVSKRFKAFIGREESDEFIRDNRQNTSGGIEPENLSREGDENADWLIGLGYKRSPNSGFSYSLGGRFSSGLQPFARVKHKYLTSFNAPHYLSFNQLAFIDNKDGFGFVSSFDYSYELGQNHIFRWASAGEYTEEFDGWEGSSSLTWFQRLGDNRGTSLRAFIRDFEGDSNNEYGLNITYRKPIHRNWLRLKVALENTWQQDYPNSRRESNLEAAIQVEMLFGKKRFFK